MKLLDCDGVLADFVSGAIKLHGLNIPSEKWVTWDYHHVLGMSDAEFFGPMNAKFWLSLKPFPWAKELLAACDDYVVCTAPVQNWECYGAKARWLHEKLGVPYTRMMIGKKKWLMASQKNLLIDDSPKNCEYFENSGGRSILFPQPYNQSKWTVQSIVSELKNEV